MCATSARAPTSRTLLNPPCQRSSLETDSPAALLLMNLSANYKQITHGVLSAESDAHQCQITGATPAQPPETRPLEFSSPNPQHFTFFYLLPGSFFGGNFSRADLACPQKLNMWKTQMAMGCAMGPEQPDPQTAGPSGLQVGNPSETMP